jgi:hypothetical protein
VKERKGKGHRWLPSLLLLRKWCNWYAASIPSKCLFNGV